jgi:hypothetical protein
MMVRAEDGSSVEVFFSESNSFASADSLDISWSDGGVVGTYSHSIVVALKKNGSAFLSLTLPTNVYAQPFTVIYGTKKS